jgi:integrase
MNNTGIYLTRRNNGYYYFGIRLSDHRVQWKTTKCTRKFDALKYLKSQSAEQTSPVIPTLLDFLPVFNERVAGIIRPATLKGYALTVQQFTNVVGNKPLSEYTLYDIDQFRAARLAKRNKPATLNIELRAIKSIFNKAEKWGIITSSVMKQVQQMKVATRIPVFLTHEDFRTICDTAKNQTFRDLLLWSVLTGCRISESLQIRWKDIDSTSLGGVFPLSPLNASWGRTWKAHQQLQFVICCGRVG